MTKGKHRRSRAEVILLVLLLVSCGLLALSFGVHSARQEHKPQQAAQSLSDSNSHPGQTTEPVELPYGGRTVLPGFRYVGLYGTPGMPVLGALGQQGKSATIARVKELAAKYQKYSKEKVIPTLEIIATVASSGPTSNNDYSQEIDIDKLRPLVDAAKEAGVYVVLDLQPGRTDFLTQAKAYEPLLKEPHVGLALDPEWRIGPKQVHLRQIGSVSATEVNATSAWLADLVKTNNLPQKVLLLHEFKLAMLPDRSAIDTSRTELAYVIQMDGQGSQNVKLDTWRNILAKPPVGAFFGWKNFYKKDKPVRSPKATMALDPTPWFVSYQ